MFTRPLPIILLAGLLTTLIAAAILVSQLPGIGAGALLYPSRRIPQLARPDDCVTREFTGAAGTLSGWHCTATRDRRDVTVIYLHGIADNRDSASGVIRHLLPLGYDVIAYDSRGHGRSDGDRCTYGYFEKDDLRHVIAQTGARHVVLIGGSLGAAVGLQTAPLEPTVRAVVAMSTFSDLRTIATQRAAAIHFPTFAIDWAFARAERDGQFVIDDASPVRAAAQINVPVLLIHGARDRDTAPSHSEAVFAALRGPKRLLIVPDAGHNDVLRDHVWPEIDRWLKESVTVDE